jgi:hypothetical protein
MPNSPAPFTEAAIKRIVAGARKGGSREVRVFLTDKYGRQIEVHAKLDDAPPGHSGENEWDQAV